MVGWCLGFGVVHLVWGDLLSESGGSCMILCLLTLRTSALNLWSFRCLASTGSFGSFPDAKRHGGVPFLSLKQRQNGNGGGILQKGMPTCIVPFPKGILFEG